MGRNAREAPSLRAGVYAEIRRRVGSGFPVGIKLNSADFQRGGFTEQESLGRFARWPTRAST
jgi:2,4-dienoyl-CoA reductase-like NADH-dependent reductase (Old Yellow Enzyme family)